MKKVDVVIIGAGPAGSVCGYLLKKAGANEANIETAAHGATVQPFKNAALNRVVTVEVK